MKKKILALCIVGMFLITCIPSISLGKTISTEPKENINTDIFVPLVYTQMIINSNPLNPIINEPFDEGDIFNKGNYQTTLDIFFHCPPFHKIVGEVWAEAWIVNEQFYLYHDYLDFTNDNIPDNIYLTPTKYIDGMGAVVLRAGYDYKVYRRYSDSDPWEEVGDYDKEKEEIVQTVWFPRDKSYINAPFLQFLEQYPILYQLLLRFLRL